MVGGKSRKSYRDNKAAQHQLEKLKRHNRVMEGRGVYLAPYKRGRDVFHIYFYISRTTLPTEGVYRNESSIINLDNAEGPGIYWVAYAKREDRAVYFDSFSNIRLLKELVRYLNVMEYNRTSYQHYDQNNYGQLCLQFLQTVDDQFKN